MPQLHELAQLVRSKNAGPFQLTIDIMFADAATYERVVASGAIDADVVAALYGIPAAEVYVILYPAAHSLKITLPRPRVSGDLDDGDIYGGQQYAPLVELEIDA